MTSYDQECLFVGLNDNEQTHLTGRLWVWVDANTQMSQGVLFI